MTKTRKWTIRLAALLLVTGFILCLHPISAGTVAAGPAAKPGGVIKHSCKEYSLFGLPTWYKYLKVAGKMKYDKNTDRCDLTTNFQVQDLGLIALAVLDILLRLAGLMTVVFVIFGSVQLITSQGDPEGGKKARQTITNALIGLVLALLSTAIVSFIGHRIA